MTNKKPVSNWETLTPEQQKEILLSYDESENDEYLITFSAIKLKYENRPLNK